MKLDKTPVIQVTDDYGIFRELKGNRDIKATRIKKIGKSIDDVGLVPVPLVVNEKFEVIDGQGRLEAVKERGLPVYFIVVPGLGVDACIAMNVSSTNWSTIDYVNMYAESGNENYIRLKLVYERYSKCGLSVVLTALTGLASAPNQRIQSGELVIHDEAMEYACGCLDYIEKYNPIIKHADIGSPERLRQALCFAYSCDKVDKGRLFESFVNNYRKIGGYSRIIECLEALSEVYNYRRRGGHVYLETEYRLMMADQYSWYDKKWGYGKDEEGQC